MTRSAVWKLLVLLWTFLGATFAEPDPGVLAMTAHIGRAVYLSQPYVRRAKCGRRVPKGNHRIQVTLERDHFQGNTMTRGFWTSTPSPTLKWPMSLLIDLQRADQTKAALRWTWEARNGSWATWERLYRAEVPLPQLLEEESDQYCMILFPKVLPPSRTYRKDPCDHLLCLTLHHMGTDTYPPEPWQHTLPMEAAVGVTLAGLFVLWVISGWVTRPLSQRLFRLTYLFPLAFLAVVVYVRLQGIEEVREGRALLYGIHWGYGEGLSYGTDADQDYHYELNVEFGSRTGTFKSTTITALAVSRTPDKVVWPEYLSWPLTPGPDQPPTVLNIRATVFADGKPVEAPYALTLDLETAGGEPEHCARATEDPQPQFCLKAVWVKPQEGPVVSLLERLPGFGIMGYGAIAFVVFALLRKRKVQDKPEEGAKEDSDDDDIDAKLARKRK